MHNTIDLVGRKFGRLSVISQAPHIGKLRAYNCVCDCGAEVIKTSHRLRTRGASSCGCLRRETAAKHIKSVNFKHGLTSAAHTPRWYVIWSGMMKRCHNPKARSFKNYGARGIKVCDRWHDPRNFIADMGEPPAGFSIERLDNDGDYCTENCKWADDFEQAKNRRNNRVIEFRGKSDTLTGWARSMGFSHSALHNRLDRMSVEEAMTMPIRRRPTSRRSESGPRLSAG